MATVAGSSVPPPPPNSGAGSGGKKPPDPKQFFDKCYPERHKKWKKPHGGPESWGLDAYTDPAMVEITGGTVSFLSSCANFMLPCKTSH